MTGRPVRPALVSALLMLLSACDTGGGSSHAPPLARPSVGNGGACSEPHVEGVSFVLFESEGACLPGDIMVLYRCSPTAVPVLRIASESGPVGFLGGPFAVPVTTLPANVRFAGSGDGMEVLIADAVEGTPSPGSVSPSASPGTAPEPISETEPLVYVRHDGVTERWLQLERRRALNDPPIAWLIGDSILDGGRDDVEAALKGWSLTIDAEVGRSSSAGIDLAAGAAQAGADVVLVELGTNDPSPAEFRANMIEILDTLRGAPLVLWQTVRGPAEDTDLPAVDAAIREVAPRYPHVAIADWSAFVPDDAFQTDGIHPDPGFESLEAELLTPLMTDWLDAMSAGGALRCGPRIVAATS